MAIKPILFNTEMVRAILDGRKSCTRRICKDANEYTVPDMDFYNADRRTYAVHNFSDKEHTEQLSIAERTCPICPGDILYVRETWQYLYELDGNEQVIEDTGKYYYAATDTIPFDIYVDENGVKHDHAPWRPSIHMPKEAARIWLKVTDVRVERLQSITVEGAIREGAEGEKCHHTNAGAFGCTDCMNTGWIEPPQVEFMQIWDSTIKKSDLDRYGWDANPYVFVIEFVKIDKPEEIQNA
nr:MAG TPA: ASCH domain protein [Caudoviricetes sp.]